MEKITFNRNEYIEGWLQKEAKNPCHRCASSNFALLDGYTFFPIQDELNGNVNLGGPNVPAILVVCEKCGAITPHATGVFKPLGTNDRKEV